MTTCEGQNFIETLWETILSSSTRETPNRILPNLAHHSIELIGLVILCVFSPLDCCLCSTGLYIKGQDWIWFLVGRCGSTMKRLDNLKR
jgi:hypothetical protein